MIVFSKFYTKSDTSGNPRRLYIVHEVKEGERFPTRLDIFIENYDGNQQVMKKYPNAIQLGDGISIPPAEYREWVHVKKMMDNQRALKAKEATKNVGN